MDLLFKKLQENDRRTCKVTQDWVQTLVTFKVPRDCLLQSGSTVEGATLARWFRQDKIDHETDIMYVFSKIPSHLENMIEPSSPGFYRIQMSADTERDMFLQQLSLYFDEFDRKLRSRFVVKVDEKSFLSAQGIREFALKKLRYKDGDKVLQNVVAQLTGSSPYDVHLADTSCVTGPSAMIELILTHKTSGHLMSFSIDGVPAVYLQFWPAQSWIKRPRNWPTSNIVQSIVENGCHLVPKTSEDADMSDLDLDWRISFSLAEITLAQNRSEFQSTAYLIFKVLFYAHLRIEIDGEHLPSYVAKTAMLWTFETKLNEEHDVSDGVAMLLEKLEEFLENHNVPHFFLPDINIIRHKRPILVKAVLKLVGEIKQDVQQYIPKNLEMITKMSEDFLSLITGAHEAMKCLSAIASLAMMLSAGAQTQTQK